MTPTGKRIFGTSSNHKRYKSQRELAAEIKRNTAQRNHQISQISAGKATIAGSLFLVLGLLLWWDISLNEVRLFTPSKVVDWDARREEVKEAFVTSWDTYTKYAWG